MPASLLFQPLTLRGLTLKNRVVVTPMCQYSAADGLVNDWHFAHYAMLAKGGPSLVFVEATGIEARGRITYGCTGIWSDDHVPGLRKVAELIRRFGAVPGIQLAHAGRKGSVQRPWHGNGPLEEADFARGERPWEVISSVPIPQDEGWLTPRALREDEIPALLEAYRAAARRAREAGFEVVEVHGAHGYLLNEFFSPLCNTRSDGYGGSFEKRMRLPLEAAQAVREGWPDDRPVFYRTSSVDDAPGGIVIEDTIRLAKALKERGIDVIDCSAGGIARASATNSPGPDRPGCYVPYARAVKRGAGVATMAVKLITEPAQAERILQEGSADLVAIGREFLFNPNWALHAARTLGVDPAFALWPEQYGWWLEKRTHGREE